MEIIIRSANETDYPAILALIKEMADFENMSNKMVNNLDLLIAEKEYFNCFVAETSENKIVGYVTYFFTYHTFIGKSLYMDDLYVVKSFRGSGVGTKLINEVIKFAKETKCHKLRWQVSNWNTQAKKFYESIGAHTDAIEQNCDLILD
jgi:ribosomal protein S18 acetylase RimI-like enzyme